MSEPSPSPPPPRVFSFRGAGRIVFGAGALLRVGELLAGMELRRVLVVADRNLGAALDCLRDRATACGIEVVVFDDGQPEPSVHVVERLLARAPGEPPDAVIGLGGGSNIDVAKAAAVLLRHGGQIGDYAGQGRLPGPALPVVAIPTTAGSGSEVSGAAILGVPADDSKLAVVDDRLRPVLALVDPKLHLGCPPEVTRDAGVDALCHAVEALTIMDWDRFARDPQQPWPLYQGRHPLTDPLAIDAVARIADALPRVLDAPNDLPARTQMALGALHAGTAMSNTGIYTVHALAYPVGAFTKASHGACNGALLPAVMDFIEPARPEPCRRIVAAMGAPAGTSLGDAVRALWTRVGAPSSLAALALPRDRLDDVARIGHGIRRLMNGSPRTTSLDQLRAVVRRAYGEPS